MTFRSPRGALEIKKSKQLKARFDVPVPRLSTDMVTWPYHSVGKDQKANGAFLTSQCAHSDEGTRWVAFGFVGFERPVSVVVSASEWDQQLNLRHILNFV